MTTDEGTENGAVEKADAISESIDDVKGHGRNSPALPDDGSDDVEGHWGRLASKPERDDRIPRSSTAVEGDGTADPLDAFRGG